MAFIGTCNIFNTFSRLIISSYKRISSGVVSLLNSDNISHDLYRSTSSF